MRKRFGSAFVLGAFLLAASPALAALKAGDGAPDFTAEAAVGGEQFTFSLAQALKKGPVVLYFYPKSFTAGCTLEAHAFAEASGRFEAAGASLIGMSADGIETQKTFSREGCRDKFPVAADPNMTVIEAYDAKMAARPGRPDIADRISYVIGPDGKILYAYSDLAPDKHVDNTLAVVEAWRKAHP